MFEDAQEFTAMRESFAPGRPQKRSQLFMRCTANASSTIGDTFVPAICYDSRGCCNTARYLGVEAYPSGAALDLPISSTTTLDANATAPPRVDE